MANDLFLQIKYAKPPKPKAEEEEKAERRVTRGRQVNYYDALMMSDETDEEEVRRKREDVDSPSQVCSYAFHFPVS